MDTDVVVIGAGVVGLAVARALGQSRRQVIVVEREAAVGTAASSRNSGVIHAGLYYPRGSLKARLCVRGKALLYDYCIERGVAHARCGKLVVATNEAETATLRAYQQNAISNDARDVRWLTREDVARLEPLVRCSAALHSESTGIVDVHELMQSLQADIEARDGRVVLNTSVAGAEATHDGFLVTLGENRDTRLSCRQVVNSAGLEAPAVARRIAGLDPTTIPAARFARGHYYALGGPAPFRRLVYPVPAGGGLGIHATIDLSGRVRFGPDVEWISEVDYRFGSDRVEQFAAEIRKYFPSVDASHLSADYTGIRPKLYGPGEVPADFRIDGPIRHGVKGLVNLYGIESPGLTASLAIGEAVVALLAA